MKVEVFSTEFWQAISPELVLVLGLVLLFLVPNLGILNSESL